MDERRLGRLALLCALIGVAGLALASQQLLAEPVSLNGLTIADAGIATHACGTVAAARARNGHYFFTLEEDGTRVPLVVFSSAAGQIDAAAVRRGDRLCAVATVNEYPPGSGELELVYRRGRFSVERP